MHSLGVAVVAFSCCFGGALVAMFIGPRLPSGHLSPETKHVVKLGMGMIATLSGLVLGLLISTSKSAFDATDSEVTQVSAKLIRLDHVLARYGPETLPVRQQLRRFVELKIDQIWPKTGRGEHGLIDPAAGVGLERALDQLDELSPANETQRSLKERALAIAGEISQARWLLIEQNADSAVATPFSTIVLFWLTILFISYGVFAPRNATSITTMLVCAISVAAALFLVLELSHPFGGIIQVSSAAARNALAMMGR